MAFGLELLQHQSSFATLEPAPSKLAIDDPFVGFPKTKSVRIEGQGLSDIGDLEERNGLPEIATVIRFLVHRCLPTCLSKSRSSQGSLVHEPGPARIAGFIPAM